MDIVVTEGIGGWTSTSGASHCSPCNTNTPVRHHQGRGHKQTLNKNNKNIPRLSPSSKEGSHVESDNTHTITNIHPLAHILDTCAWILSSYARFSSSQPHQVTASHRSLGDNHQSMGGRSERIQGQAIKILIILKRKIVTSIKCAHRNGSQFVNLNTVSQFRG